MAEFVANEKPIRQRALEALKEVFASQREHLPAEDPYGFKWDQVLMSPTTKADFKKQRTLGIFDGHEAKTDKLMVKHCVLRVALEINIVIQADQNPSEEINLVFGAVQRRVQEDPSLGGLIIDVQEISNDHQVSDENQRHVEGVIFLDLQYRHSVRDPRRIA